MNIVEAYTKFNKQNIILISGMSGSGKTTFAKFISKIFKYKFSTLSDFYYSDEIYNKDYNYIVFKDGKKILDWDNIYNSVNWDAFNSHVDIHKKNGIVISGFGFPEMKLKFKPEFHIHIKISKQQLMENRKSYMQKHLEKTDDKIRDPQIEKYIFNNITFPHYQKINNDSNINLYINASEKTEDEVQDNIFSYLIGAIKKWIENYNNKIIMNRPYTKEMPYDGHSSLSHNGEAYAYDTYFHNKKRKLYDFDERGIDYPEEYRKKYDNRPDDSSDEENQISNTSDTDTEFLFTVRD